MELQLVKIQNLALQNVSFPAIIVRFSPTQRRRFPASPTNSRILGVVGSYVPTTPNVNVYHTNVEKKNKRASDLSGSRGIPSGDSHGEVQKSKRASDLSGYPLSRAEIPRPALT